MSLFLLQSLVSPKVLAFAALPSLKLRLSRSKRGVQSCTGAVVASSSGVAGSFNSSLFVDRVPFQDGDLDHCWYCAGMLKTVRTFFADTAEKHASPAPASIADHPISTCRKFKMDMLDLAWIFLKPGGPPRVLAAVVDSAHLPSDPDLSPDSESVDTESLNKVGLATLKIVSRFLSQWFCPFSMVLLLLLLYALCP